jgi:translation elongation factor P/translation initiation factor 5A
MNLYAKRDSLQKQIIGGTQVLDKEDYEKLELEVNRIQDKSDNLKFIVNDQRKRKAEISSGV